MTPPPADAKLLPPISCPFCGAESKLFSEHDGEGIHCRVRCSNKRCRAEQELRVDHAEYVSERRAIEAWNTRVTPPAAPAEDHAWAQLAADCGVSPDCESRDEFVALMRQVVEQASALVSHTTPSPPRSP